MKLFVNEKAVVFKFKQAYHIADNNKMMVLKIVYNTNRKFTKYETEKILEYINSLLKE